jgi:alkanesulfonate monooxygenase SsuD/methylene tetrahydromethanopterin reductase-like flavin-dependent oxidoreductase (luciferase family)
LDAELPTWIGRVTKTRGFAVPTEASFLREIGPDGALYVGSPETVAAKIVATMKTLGANRFDLKYAMGGLSDDALLTNIHLFGPKSFPQVRELLAWRPGA